LSWRDAGAALVERSGIRPRVGVVLGSGLGAVADAVEDAVAIDYGVLSGRAHLYEGIDVELVRTPVRALHAAGAEILLLTNAAGSLRPEVRPGRLMLITDHINMSGRNVLIGPNEDELGERFTSLRGAYDPDLAGRLRAAAGELDIDLAEGVYLAVSGPSFETAAEIRAFRTLGADAVGMSTVHETVVARHCGLRVAAVSAVTNLAEGLSAEPLSHEQTLRDAARAAGDLVPLVTRFVEGLR
jgi:xanthosine phosphorylase